MFRDVDSGGAWVRGKGFGETGEYGNLQQNFTVNLKLLFKITSVFKSQAFLELPVFHKKGKIKTLNFRSVFSYIFLPWVLFLTFKNNTLDRLCDQKLLLLLSKQF